MKNINKLIKRYYDADTKEYIWNVFSTPDDVECTNVDEDLDSKILQGELDVKNVECCTGLFDKNNHLIYDKDVVSFKDKQGKTVFDCVMIDDKTNCAYLKQTHQPLFEVNRKVKAVTNIHRGFYFEIVAIEFSQKFKKSYIDAFLDKLKNNLIDIDVLHRYLEKDYAEIMMLLEQGEREQAFEKFEPTIIEKIEHTLNFTHSLDNDVLKATVKEVTSAGTIIKTTISDENGSVKLTLNETCLNLN